jgi:hypothetical protein
MSQRTRTIVGWLAVAYGVAMLAYLTVGGAR